MSRVGGHFHGQGRSVSTVQPPGLLLIGREGTGGGRGGWRLGHAEVGGAGVAVGAQAGLQGLLLPLQRVHQVTELRGRAHPTSAGAAHYITVVTAELQVVWRVRDKKRKDVRWIEKLVIWTKRATNVCLCNNNFAQ